MSAQARTKSADFVGSCARFRRKSRRRMQITAWDVPMDACQALACVNLPSAFSTTSSGGEATCPASSVLYFRRRGLCSSLGNLRPGHPEVLKLPLGHGSELKPGAGAISPDPHDIYEHPPGLRDHRRSRRTGTVGGRDVIQLNQLAALTGACGNGPSAFSVRTESQYSLISLILPSSSRNTRQ